MSTVFDQDILIHHIAAPGLPGDGFTAPEAATLRDDIDTLLSRPVITEINDIPNVDTSDVANGDVMIYDAGSEMWEAGQHSGAVSYIETTPPTTVVMQDAERLTFRDGLLAVQSGVMPSRAIIDVSFGGTGSVKTVPFLDHAHVLPFVAYQPITPQGYMSGGTRSLQSTNLGLPAGKTCLVEARLKTQVRGGDPGASYYVLNLSINGNTRSTPGGTDGFWCVQGVPDKPEWAHRQTIVGTGATISVSASITWHSGGGFYTDAGDLEVRITYNR